MTAALRFLVLIEVLGLAAMPLAAVVLGRLPGAASASPSRSGLLLATWLVWMRRQLGTCVAARALGDRGIGAAARWLRGRARAAVRAGGAAGAPELPPPHGAAVVGGGWPRRVRASMALLVAYSPDVWNTEKPMDMAFINAAGDARHFPPHDPWMAGEDLNYYYLGHLMAAGLVRLSGVEPDAATTSRSRLLRALRGRRSFALAVRDRRRGCATAALRGVALCVVAGTIGLAGVRAARGRRAAARLRLVRRRRA